MWGNWCLATVHPQIRHPAGRAPARHGWARHWPWRLHQPLRVRLLLLLRTMDGGVSELRNTFDIYDQDKNGGMGDVSSGAIDRMVGGGGEATTGNGQRWMVSEERWSWRERERERERGAVLCKFPPTFTPIGFSLTKTNAPNQTASPDRSQVHLKATCI